MRPHQNFSKRSRCIIYVFVLCWLQWHLLPWEAPRIFSLDILSILFPKWIQTSSVLWACFFRTLIHYTRDKQARFFNAFLDPRKSLPPLNSISNFGRRRLVFYCCFLQADDGRARLNKTCSKSLQTKWEWAETVFRQKHSKPLMGKHVIFKGFTLLFKLAREQHTFSFMNRTF